MKETLRINPDSRSLLETHGLVGILSVFAFQQGERMDKAGLESWRQRWRIRLQDTRGSNTVFYLKRFNRPPFRRQWSRWKEGHLFTSTAGVEWHNATALAEAGISAAQPAACGEQMIGPWEQRSFILLKEVPGQSLEKWVPQKLSPTTQEENLADRRVRLYELADFVAKFHTAGFVHRDLYLSHIFIHEDDCENQSSGRTGGRYTLIDLQRVFQPRWRKRRWVVKDLAALHYSTPASGIRRWERLRFICRYARQCACFGSARQLARRVAAKTDRMNRRRAGPMITD